MGGTAAATANAGSDVTVCENTLVTLNATGGVTFAWSNGLGNSSTASFIASVTTTYSVEVTDINGCTATDQVVVTVNTLPAQPVITASGPTTFCLGNSVDLTSSYVGNNVWSTSANTDAITINAVGNYSIDVTYTDANGCSVTTSVTIINNGGPSSINTLITDENCGNSDASIEITLVTGGVSPFEYAINALPYNSTPLFTGLSAGVNTIYVKDSFGCIYEQILVLGGTAAATANAGSDVTVCENTLVTLNATGGVTFAWSNGLG
ncbi:MAG: hypothetical protein ACK5QU_13000, partial [Bacteroidota bacterium]